MQGTSGLPRCGELHLRKEDFKRQLEGPVGNKAPSRGFTRFVTEGLLTDVGEGIREVNRMPRKPSSPIITGRTQCNKRPLKVRATREGPLGRSYNNVGHSHCQLKWLRREGEKKYAAPPLHTLTFCRT